MHTLAGESCDTFSFPLHASLFCFFAFFFLFSFFLFLLGGVSFLFVLLLFLARSCQKESRSDLSERVFFFLSLHSVCICVNVYVCEREREGGRERES